MYFKTPVIFEFNIPANTLESNPTKLEVDVPMGEVKHIQVVIPMGHQGLARMRMSTKGQRIIPASNSNVDWLRGDSFTLDTNPDMKLPGPPYQITFEGWNQDAVNPHLFLIYME